MAEAWIKNTAVSQVASKKKEKKYFLRTWFSGSADMESNAFQFAHIMHSLFFLCNSLYIHYRSDFNVIVHPSTELELQEKSWNLIY